MAKVATSYIKCNGTARTRTTDALSWPITFRPQALSVYVRFIERGGVHQYNDGSIVIVGGAGNTSFHIGANTATSYRYRATYLNAAATSTYALLAAGPTEGQLVELLATLSATGSVSLSQSIAGATATTAGPSSALALPTAWLANTVLVRNCIALRNLVIVRGVQSLATMRRFAGAW